MVYAILLVATLGGLLWLAYTIGHVRGGYAEYAKFADRCNFAVASHVEVAHSMLKDALQVIDGKRDAQEFKKLYAPDINDNMETLHQADEAAYWIFSGGHAILAAIQGCQNADDRARLRQSLASVVAFLDGRKKTPGQIGSDLEQAWPGALSRPQDERSRPQK